MGGMRVLTVIGLMLGGMTSAHSAVILNSISSSSLSIIKDGTSNTIQLGESTRASLCFQNVTLPPTITDGTSNTIQFNETTGLEVIPGGTRAWAPVSQIADGTSNTIFFPEAGTTQLCFRDTEIEDPVTITDGTSNTIEFGENTRFDICITGSAVSINDGSSNTILLGERVCYEDVQIADNLTTSPVPEPATLAVLLAGLTGLYVRRRRLGHRDA